MLLNHTIMESLNYYENAVEIFQKLIDADCIVDNDDIKFLLDSDKSKMYQCSPKTESSGFTLLHKCVILTRKYPVLNNILLCYLETDSQFAQSINSTTTNGWTPLHLAARNSRTMSTEKTVKILIFSGADVNSRSEYNCIPLHYASHYSRTESTEGTVKILIDAGSNVNLQDSNGWVPLHYASRYSRTNSTEKTVKILLAAGANVTLKNKDDQTPLQLASKFFLKASTEETINTLKIAEDLTACEKYIGECVTCNLL